MSTILFLEEGMRYEGKAVSQQMVSRTFKIRYFPTTDLTHSSFIQDYAIAEKNLFGRVKVLLFFNTLSLGDSAVGSLGKDQLYKLLNLFQWLP